MLLTLNGSCEPDSVILMTIVVYEQIPVASVEELDKSGVDLSQADATHLHLEIWSNGTQRHRPNLMDTNYTYQHVD